MSNDVYSYLCICSTALFRPGGSVGLVIDWGAGVPRHVDTTLICLGTLICFNDFSTFHC